MITPPSDTAILDLDVLAAMYGDTSLDTVMAALTGFYPAAASYVAAIEQAGRSNTLADLAAAAHSLKGICGLVGANPLAELSGQLEHAARHGETKQLQQQLALLPHCWQLLEQQLVHVLQR